MNYTMLKFLQGPASEAVRQGLDAEKNEGITLLHATCVRALIFPEIAWLFVSSLEGEAFHRNKALPELQLLLSDKRMCNRVGFHVAAASI